MTQSLGGKKVLVLVANGVDEGGMSTIQRELLKAQAKVSTIGADASVVSSWNGQEWGVNFPTDAHVNTTLGSDFDILVVPSGERSTKTLTGNAHSERIIASFVAAHKPMCFVGNAVELLDATGHSSAKEHSLALESIEGFVEKLSDTVAHFSEAPVELKEAA